MGWIGPNFVRPYGLDSPKKDNSHGSDDLFTWEGFQSQAEVGRPSRAMKRPAALRKPARMVQKQASKKSKAEAKKGKEKEVEQEGEEEEPKEEDEEQEEKVNLPLTQKALKDHQAFLEHASKLSDQQFDKAFAKLPEAQQQSLWKRFESSRKAVGRDDEYKKETTGTGSQVRKKHLLRSWCMDGGKCSERYKKAFASITLEKKHGVEKTWLSKKQMEDELGLEEMKARLAAKTLKWRRNPEDGRFFQFQKLSEKEATWLNKKKSSQVEAAGEATAKDLVSFDQLMLEEIDEDDFVMGAGEEDASETEGMDKDLAKLMGLKDKEKKEKKDKEDKWAKLSQVGNGTKSDEIQEKLMKFKTEISKDLATLEGGEFALKKAGEKTLLKHVQAVKKKAAASLGEITKLMAKKGAKAEVVAVLTKALSSLKECKAAKVQLSKALKA